MERRQFMINAAKGFVGLSMMSMMPLDVFGQSKAHVVWVENGEPELLLKTALKDFGGLTRFINKGDVVVIKPNIGWDRRPEQAANTNPDLIKALVKECFDAGASKVKILDRTCNNPRRCYINSGIESSAKEVGAEVVHVHDNKYVNIPIKNGKVLKEWPIYKDYIEADKVINVPIAKHHSLARVTLGMKNLMGVMGANRGDIHSYFDWKLTDIVSEILPTLTIIDAYRILLRNGPSGGSLNDVAVKKTLIMSDCVVCADVVALSLFDLNIHDVSHVKTAIERKMAKYDVDNLVIDKIDLSV
ncbi:MAG: DUF362 domain-containing protein [Calditrichia bacterium]